jgi:SAM-dependent methyltransferase
MPFSDGTFATAMANSALEHIPDIGAAIAETYRILCPGGRLLLTIPLKRKREWLLFSEQAPDGNHDCAAEQYRKQFDARWEHEHYLTTGQLTELLRDAGFQDVAVTEFEDEETAHLIDALCYVQVSLRRVPQDDLDKHVLRAMRRYWVSLLAHALREVPIGAGACAFCVASR